MLRSRHSGFTLLEMMIALGAGAAIILVAVAGFRSASQVVQAARRLIVEGEGLAVGIQSGFDETDFWVQYDDPDNANRQGNRSKTVLKFNGADYSQIPVGGGGSGTESNSVSQPSRVENFLPFTPFSSPSGAYLSSWPNDTTSPAPARSSYNGFGYGWQENELFWLQTADNTLTWWTGLGVQRGPYSWWSGGGKGGPRDGAWWSGCDRFGNYQILGISVKPLASQSRFSLASQARFSLGSNAEFDYGNGGPISIPFAEYFWDEESFGAQYKKVFGDNNAEYPVSIVNYIQFRRSNQGWLYNQIRGSMNAMGWYGSMDYMPANAMISYIKEFCPNGGSYAGCQALTDYTGRPYFTAGYHEWANRWVLSPGAWLSGYAAANYPFNNKGSRSMAYDINFLTYFTCIPIVPNAVSRDSVVGVSGSDQERLYMNRNALGLGSFERLANASMDKWSWTYAMSDAWIYDKDRGKWVTDTTEMSWGSVGLLSDRIANYAMRVSSLADSQPIHPRSMPSVSISASRDIFRGRWNNQMKIGWGTMDNGGGELRFSTLGTTFRGARRQRTDLEWKGRIPE